MRLFLVIIFTLFIQLTARAEQLDVILRERYRCENCGNYHDQKHNKGRLYLSFKGELPLSQHPKFLRLWIQEAGNTKTYTNWKINLDKEMTFSELEGGIQSWQADWGMVTLELDGVFSVLIKNLHLSPQFKEIIHTGYSYDVWVGVEGENDKVVLKSQKTRTLGVNLSNKSAILRNPYSEKDITLSEIIDNKPVQFYIPPTEKEFSLQKVKSPKGPQQIWIIVPLYREFYNQNLGAFLVSLASQVHNPFGQDVHVLFHVNNTQNVNPEIRLENEETVNYLRQLSLGQVPQVRPESEILRQAIFKILASQIKIHVMDHTNPGYEKRNIGIVRDDALKFVMNKIPANQRDRALIAQMDGDSRVPSDYLSQLYEAFSNSSLKYALLSMNFGTERGSSLATYKRMIMAEIWFASYAFYDASSARQPLSGSPRIIATASAMADVGGVPHSEMGEDRDLVTRLRERFQNHGRWLSKVSVEVSFRGREDGYDASYYLRRMNEPVKLEEREIETLRLVEKSEKQFEASPDRVHYRNARYIEILAQREKDVRARIALLNLNIVEFLRDGKITTFDPRVDLGLYSSPEFESYLREKLSENKNVSRATVKAIVADFPHILQIQPPKESMVLARIQAATDTHLVKDSEHGTAGLMDRACVAEILKMLTAL